MTRYLSSLRVRLLAALLLLVIVVVFGIFLNNRTAIQAQDARRQIKAIGDQETNVYLLASLARRFDNTNDEAEQQSVLTLIQDNIQDFETIQLALRNGNKALELRPLHGQQLLAALDELDARWANYRSLLERFAKADPAARTQLEPQIDAQSATVYAFAVRVDKYLDVTIEQDARSTQQILIVLVGVAVLVTLFAVYVIIQIIRSTHALASTANQLATGNLKARADASGITELDGLGNVLNDMAEQIETRIAETEAARARAERSDQVKSAFLASMSHELRTPLNAIINFTKFVAKGDLGPVNQEQEETLNEVIGSSKHLLSLINDVLDMSKIEAGSLQLFVEENVDLRSILDTVLSTGKSLIAEKTVEMLSEIDGSLPPIRGDRHRILQILLNIMSNACKFTDQGHIRVAAHSTGGQVLIAIEDTGPGIAPEDQALVFEAFKQTSTGLRQRGGTGLGMPISKNLAETHGGRLWLESEVGKGSIFYLNLPVKSEQLMPVLGT